MRAFRHSLRMTMRGLLVPWILVSLLGGLALGVQPQLDGMGADQAAGMWLYLPGLVLMLAAMTTAIDCWPLFSRARPGGEWLARIAPRPWHGCVAAAAGTLVALTLYLTLAAGSFLVAARWTDTELAPPRERMGAEPDPGAPHLESAASPRRFRIRDPRPAAQLRLRIFGLLGPDTSPAEIQVRTDGVCAHPEEPWIATAGGLLELQLGSGSPGLSTGGRVVREIEVRRRADRGIVLRIDAASVQLVGAENHSILGNAILAMWTFLLPALLGCAVMILGHRHLAMPVNLGAGAGIGLLAVLLGWGPTDWIRGFSRGSWLLAEPLAADLIPCLLGTVALLALAGLAGLGGSRAASR